MNDASRPQYRIYSSLLDLIIGDITNETTDAIVNAANSSLMGGGGDTFRTNEVLGGTLSDEAQEASLVE